MIGEFLYNLTEKEAVSQAVLQRWMFDRLIATIGITTTMLFRVPRDRLCIIEHLWMNAFTAGVTKVSRMVVHVQDEALNNIATLFERSAIALVDTTTNDSLAGQLLRRPIVIFPLEQLEVIANFSGGAAGNSHRVSMSGFFLPPGTLQRDSLITVQ